MTEQNCDIQKKATFTIKQVGETQDIFSIQGYALTFDEDLDGDRISNTARIDLPEKKFKILAHHDWDDPIGLVSNSTFDEKGLFIRGELPKTVEKSQEMIAMIKAGLVDSMSIGFKVKDFVANPGGSGMLFTHIMIREVSIVTFPANQNAEITSFKKASPFKDLPLAPRNMRWDKAAAVTRVRKKLDSEDSPSTDYKNAFFWYDATKPENFTSYKLPFADVVNGELRAVPRAIFAARAAIGGARGGVDIPSQDLEAVKANIAKYYVKMGLDNPFVDNKFIREDLMLLSNRDLETVLRKGATFSNDAAKLLVSLLPFNEEPRDAVVHEKNSEKQCDVVSHSEIGQSDINTLIKTINSLKEVFHDNTRNKLRETRN